MKSTFRDFAVAHPLARKLWLLLTAIFLVTYASMSAVRLYNVSAHWQTSVEKGLSVLAADRFDVIRREFSYQATNVRAWAKLDVMNDLVSDDVDKRITEALIQMKGQYRLPGDVYAFNAAGKLVASSAARWTFGSRMPPIWRAAIRKRTGFVDTRNPYGGGGILAFTAPVYAAFAPRQAIGFLVLTYPWSTVTSLLSRGGGRLVVLDRDRGDQLLYNGIGGHLSAAILNELRAGRTRIHTPDGAYWAAYAKGPVAAAAGANSTPERPTWIIAAVEPTGEVFGPLKVVWRRLVLWVFLLGVPMSLLLLWVSRRVIRPISELTSVALDISDSPDQSRRIAVTTRDEIGALQGAFNRMTTRLQRTLEERTKAVKALEELNATLEAMAMTDSLTGLFNRRAAEMRFVEEVARAKRNDGVFSVAVCDLDNFKLVNDYFGHPIGDRVLQHVADILRRTVRPEDWVARWGGEEFILFLDRADGEGALIAATRVRDAIKSQPLKADQATIPITASFGIGVWESGDEGIARVLSDADERLYEAKKKGRDRIVAPKSADQCVLKRAAELQVALDEGRLVPAYQVMVDLATNEVVANEALARIRMDDGTVLPAAQFIEAAEDIHLIHLVDDSISRQAMLRCSEMLRSAAVSPGFAHFINLSPNFLSRPELVDSLLRDARMFCADCNGDFGAHKPIVFEITERQALVDFDDLRRRLQPLLDFGFRVALDDFGSGYSSFLYLAELPVHFIKIEGRMVRGIRRNAAMLHIVESIVALARPLGITTIAECVEDGDTAALLRDLGVDWGQGYYFGRPALEPPTGAAP